LHERYIPLQHHTPLACKLNDTILKLKSLNNLKEDNENLSNQYATLQADFEIYNANAKKQYDETIKTIKDLYEKLIYTKINKVPRNEFFLEGMYKGACSVALNCKYVEEWELEEWEKEIETRLNYK
jgi:hypothetical protein